MVTSGVIHLCESTLQDLYGPWLNYNSVCESISDEIHFGTKDVTVTKQSSGQIIATSPDFRIQMVV